MNSRNKGARGEKLWRDFLRSRGIQAERGRQHHGRDDAPDVLSGDGIHWEVKNVERFNAYDAIDQSRRDAGDKPYLVAHKRNRKPWLVVTPAEDLERVSVAWLRALGWRVTRKDGEK